MNSYFVTTIEENTAYQRCERVEADSVEKACYIASVELQSRGVCDFRITKVEEFSWERMQRELIPGIE